MKKVLSLLFVFTLAMFLAACGSSEDVQTETPNTGAEAEETPTEATEELPNEIIMGFVPSQDSANIADTVEPLADRLSEELGIPVSGQVMTNYTALYDPSRDNCRCHDY